MASLQVHVANEPRRHHCLLLFLVEFGSSLSNIFSLGRGAVLCRLMEAEYIVSVLCLWELAEAAH
ncbi:hypothetical protein E2C01_043961 [Portunus trituberculatus]|uniref:Uncharacterized protein n=1 Tax=Portunus trituberculatus TaxID=210409 RepID=A0A5B7FY54_PORTR|nr:hypothetical protein [Portunus trituberculatus]